MPAPRPEARPPLLGPLHPPVQGDRARSTHAPAAEAATTGPHAPSTPSVAVPAATEPPAPPTTHGATRAPEPPFPRYPTGIGTDSIRATTRSRTTTPETDWR